ncbi:amidase [Marinobacter caseinilyticus]|uniref:amidase n=1 Tax=Marinobacter caseinilyticus TaxID=2692195 RepID=UPI00140C73A9|nr:amidase [Marinobacter caseinilyticus]
MTFHTLSCFDLADGIRHRRYTAETVLDHFLERIERLNPELNAVVVIQSETARRQAQAADAAAERGESWGPLHGVPMTIKETFELEGWLTTSGHGKLRQHVSTRTAPAVQRLIDAGAIIMGKTNVPELAGDLQSYNSLYGTTRNPWDVKLTPGGSSGGAAAALAAGLTPLELGSDIGGSIRTPAAFCGVYGLKPTYGLVPTRGHIPGPPGNLAHRDITVAGPMARHLDDLEQALMLLAGPDDDLAPGWQIALPAAREIPLTQYRVATWVDDDYAPVDAAVRTGLQQVIASLQALGASITPDARPVGWSLKRIDALYYDLLAGVIGGGLAPAMHDKLTEFATTSRQNDYRTRFARGATQSHAHWLAQDEQRAQLQARWAEFFQHYDVLLCPVINTLPFPHSQDRPATDRTLTINGQPRPYLEATVWAGLAAVAGLPALSVPIGLSPEGLPLAVQIVGPKFSDRTLIEYARQLQNAGVTRRVLST